MGYIKYETKVGLPTIKSGKATGETPDVYVLYDAGEADEYGYEIEVEEYSYSMYNTILSVSFGYEEWSRELWEMLGNALSMKLIGLYEGEGPAAVKVYVDQLRERAYDCSFMEYQVPEDESMLAKNKRRHMVDLEDILKLIEENDPERLETFLSTYSVDQIRRWATNDKEATDDAE